MKDFFHIYFFMFLLDTTKFEITRFDALHAIEVIVIIKKTNGIGNNLCILV